MAPARPVKSRVRVPVHVAGWLAIVVIVGTGLETAGYLFLTRMREQHRHFFHFDIDAYVGSLHPEPLRMHRRAAELGRLREPHPVLGWSTTPLSSHRFPETGTAITTDAQGARIIPNAAGPVSLATYGDSFTEGLEVGDTETWQAYIAYATGTRVLNYGVSGYGPDQALLALEEHLRSGLRSPVVILAMIDENLNRMMNTFRLFYTYPTEDLFLGFKPIFVWTDTGFVVRQFAPADVTDVEALRRALWTASEYDWWYQQRTIRVRFPFSIRAAGFVARHGFDPEPAVPDFATGLPRARIEYILQRFHDDGRRYGFVPVFVLLPENAHDLRTRRGGDHPLFSAIVGSGRLPDLVYIDVVKALTGEQSAEFSADTAPRVFFNVTHPSARGNRAIANVILAALRPQLDRPRRGQGSP